VSSDGLGLFLTWTAALAYLQESGIEDVIRNGETVLFVAGIVDGAST
jgi:hypothetical protein